MCRLKQTKSGHAALREARSDWRSVLCALREGMASSSINPLTNRPYSQRYYSILEVRIA